MVERRRICSCTRRAVQTTTRLQVASDNGITVDQELALLTIFRLLTLSPQINNQCMLNTKASGGSTMFALSLLQQADSEWNVARSPATSSFFLLTCQKWADALSRKIYRLHLGAGLISLKGSCGELGECRTVSLIDCCFLSVFGLTFLPVCCYILSPSRIFAVYVY